MEEKSGSLVWLIVLVAFLFIPFVIIVVTDKKLGRAKLPQDPEISSPKNRIGTPVPDTSFGDKARFVGGVTFAWTWFISFIVIWVSLSLAFPVLGLILGWIPALILSKLLAASVWFLIAIIVVAIFLI